jgi:hypothetical protein
LGSAAEPQQNEAVSGNAQRRSLSQTALFSILAKNRVVFCDKREVLARSFQRKEFAEYKDLQEFRMAMGASMQPSGRRFV